MNGNLLLGLLAQLVERNVVNVRVAGSSPAEPSDATPHKRDRNAGIGRSVRFESSAWLPFFLRLGFRGTKAGGFYRPAPFFELLNDINVMESIQKWEYATAFYNTWEGSTPELRLNEIGEDGWELVSVVDKPQVGTAFYFKRPKKTI